MKTIGKVLFPSQVGEPFRAEVRLSGREQPMSRVSPLFISAERTVPVQISIAPSVVVSIKCE